MIGQHSQEENGQNGLFSMTSVNETRNIADNLTYM
jgi:hypothetical protein